jgi:ABC-type branched-subunit amino acid transport system ATPase component
VSDGATLLAADGITAGYGRLDILHGVSLRVQAGEIVSVIGPNGAGKSTAFKAIVGLLRPRAGMVRFNGESFPR